MRKTTFAAAAAVLLLITSSAAQAPALSLISPDPQSEGRFGCSVAFAGDINGDGVREIAVSAAGEHIGPSPQRAGRAHVFDGRSGALIRTLSSPTEHDAGAFGSVVLNIGDVDGDAVDDLLVTAPGESSGLLVGAGRVHIFSGATGLIVRSIGSPNAWLGGAFGFAAALAGDVDGDGTDDLIIGAPYESRAGYPAGVGFAYVISYAGAPIYELVNWSLYENEHVGSSVAGVGDSNGDGFADLLVGGPDVNGSHIQMGLAHHFDGASGGETGTIISIRPTDAGRFGGSVSGVGDVDGDGLPDYIIGARGDTSDTKPLYPGRAQLQRSATGPLSLASPNEQDGGQFGAVVSAAGDLTGDGVPDILVSAVGESDPGAPAEVGRVHILSGADGDRWTTLTFPSTEAGAHFGSAVAGNVDHDGDGWPDVLVGAVQATYGAVRTGLAFLFHASSFVDAAPPTPRHTLTVSVTPNPVSAGATIRWSAPIGSRTRIVLYDVLGRNVGVIIDGTSSGQTETARWNRRDLPAGTYVLRLYSESESVATRLTVVR